MSVNLFKVLMGYQDKRLKKRRQLTVVSVSVIDKNKVVTVFSRSTDRFRASFVKGKREVAVGFCVSCTKPVVA